MCVFPLCPPSEGTCGDATLLFYGLVVAAGKYRTLKHDGRFCACKGAFSEDARQNGRRGRSRAAAVSRQTGRSPGRALAALEPAPPRCALMPLNHPQLTQAAMPSWHCGGRCFGWHGDSPLLEGEAFSPHWPGWSGRGRDIV